VTFIAESEQQLFDNFIDEAFEIQVGIHELLGHGSGKLFQIDEKGNLNFDKNSVVNPLTKKPIESWYLSGETWDSKFLSSASTMEECRAECCGLYLCTNLEILSIFGHLGKNAEDVAYVNWLSMVRKGLIALEYYSPETNKWRQAHMQARFVILNILREAGQDFVRIENIEKDPIVKLDRTNIATVGRKAIGSFLTKLMIYKATANVEECTKMYNKYSEVNTEYLNLRKIVLEKKKALKIFIQPHTYILDGKVQLKTFDPSPKGMIDSFVTRYGPTN